MKILRAIIQDYVATAEPIGSRTIARKFDLGISPATIRNEMSDLEELGLIEQPHTSAGRIPSDAGYRYYVDCLMEPADLAAAHEELLKQVTMKRITEIQEVVAQTSRLLSQLTSLTSIVLGPQAPKSLSKFYQMHFLDFQPGKAILVIGKENGSVENHVVDIGENVTIEELQTFATVFSQKMRGHTFSEIRRTLLHEIYNELARQKLLIGSAMEMIEAIFLDHEEKEQVYVGGTLNILNQPEFRDLNKVRDLLSSFEETSTLIKLLNTGRAHKLNITIGGENSLSEFKNCSIVSATYHINGEPIGTIGVLGPTRMDYSKVVAAVDLMTKTLSNILTYGYGGRH